MTTTPALGEVQAAATRVTAFLDEYAQMAGQLHPEIIQQFGLNDDTLRLTVADLRTLAASADLVGRLRHVEPDRSAPISEVWYRIEPVDPEPTPPDLDTTGDRWYIHRPGGAILYGDGTGGATPVGVLAWGHLTHDVDRTRAIVELAELAKLGLVFVGDDGAPAYPHTGTCDGCAEGPVPLRAEGSAGVCPRCDLAHHEAVVEAVQAAITAYDAHYIREAS